MTYKYSENEIRDHLSSNLELIEPGLKLIDVELHLRNPIGSAGRIDILASDRFNNRVIIELKRSNKTAREAIHEIHKYVALFRSQHGLPTRRIRCIIVSTEWRELIVPFSEFVTNSTYQIEGRQLLIDSTGRIKEATRVYPKELDNEVSFFLAHGAHLFKSESGRRDSVPKFISELKKTIAAGFILIEIDYEGDDHRVITPYCLYLVFSSLNSDTYDSWRKEYREEHDYEEDEVEDVWFDDYCNVKLTESIELPHDDFEIGNSEKLHTILQTGWNYKVVHRHGNVQSELAISNEDLISQVSGHWGENTVFFSRITRPGFHLDWDDIKNKALHSLTGNSSWTNGFKLFCQIVEEKHSNASVSINIYNPLNLPISLYKLVSKGDGRYLPLIEFIASDDLTNSILVMQGEVRWNGKKSPTLREAFKSFEEGLWGFFVSQHFNLAWQKDKEIMAAHGLDYVLRLSSFTSGKEEEVSSKMLCEEEGRLIEHSNPDKMYEVDRFIKANASYVLKLIRNIQEFAVGL